MTREERVLGDTNLKLLHTKQPDEKLIETLESLLKQAREGELIGLAYVLIWHGQYVGRGWSGLHDAYIRQTISELSLLEHEIKDEVCCREDY